MHHNILRLQTILASGDLIAKLWNMKTDACSFSVDFLHMISGGKSQLTPWPAWETGFVNYSISKADRMGESAQLSEGIRIWNESEHK